jgi:molybdopterin synthase catalytic subunit
MYKSITISEQALDVDGSYQALKNACPKSGAVVFFVGLVRDFYEADSPDKISNLELEHYAGFTEQMLDSIVQEASARWTLDGVNVVHRVGKIDSGDEIVLVATASAHRADAFQASEFIMDYLKTRATIWKKQAGDRGDEWVEQKASDLQRAESWVK